MLLLNDLDDGTAAAQFRQAAARLTAAESEFLRNTLANAAARARVAGMHWDFEAPAKLMERLLFSDPPADSGANGRLRRAIVARLALEHFEIADRLPDSIRSLFLEFLQRLSAFTLTEGEYPSDFFSKDVRYALGLTAPAGALQFDLHYRIGPKLIVRDAAARRVLGPINAYLRSAAWGRWYNYHLDLRSMREFHPDGWNRFFLRMAETLELNPRVRGLVAIGWLYDPEVAAITPHLTYVQDPLSHGGFRVRIGVDPRQFANATFRSAVRRKLFEQGRYVPTVYLMAWPRRAVLAWAAQQKMPSRHPVGAPSERLREPNAGLAGP